MRFAFLRICGVLLAINYSLAVYSQRISQYQFEAGGLTSSAHTPFWLRANQYGTVPLTNPALRIDASLHSDYQPRDSTGYRPKTDWGYGVNVVANVGNTNQFLLPEAYVKGRYGAFELYVGRRKEVIGLMDTLLTTGSYIWSGNAMPMPKIQLSIPTYTPIPFTNGVLSIMGTFSHGWFENSDRYVTGTYLHQSSFYGRFGKPSWRVRIHAGFNHQVMWAGLSNYINPSVVANGQLPSSIKYYPAVVLGIRNPFQDDQNILTDNHFEENRIGNHLGTIDFAADVDLNDWNLYAYRQFIYETGSLFYGTNLADGLNGIRIKNRREPDGAAFFLQQLTFEYLFTGSQGGDVFVLLDPYRRGRNDYFNNSQYIDGWTYYGRTIGTPFMTAYQEVRSSLPPRYGIANNRVSAFHLGLSALLFDKVTLTTRLSLSRNAGTYQIPYLAIPTQFSGLLTASVPFDFLGGIVLNGALAADTGGLLPNSVGTYISLRKTGVFGKPRPTFASPRRGF
jgi:hypothetical protein